MFTKILIANRGEIARRIMRTARRMGVRTVAVYSDADCGAAHVRDADEAVRIGPGPAKDSYLREDRVIEAALGTGADAVHPGYGFLSESAHFAEAVLAAGLAWIGPEPAAIRAVADKAAARLLMAAAGVPVSLGGPIQNIEEAVRLAEAIGFPIIVKSSGGGGGIGMQVARNETELCLAFERARSLAERFFGDPALLIERFLERARHVEVQIVGLADGTVLALGERDCSVQRRFQKVIEETPCPAVDAGLRNRMVSAAIACAERLRYKGVGTVEFLLDGREFVFLELNARLQVEHPVTELVTGLDLVEAQLEIARGLSPSTAMDVTPTGHAIELRVYAEDGRRFLPSPGTITRWREPSERGIRVDSGYEEGDVVSAFYDPLLAKLCVHGTDRRAALDRAASAIANFEIEGPRTNLTFLAEALARPEFQSGQYDTSLVSLMRSHGA